MTTADRPYNNPTTQRERAEIVKNERKLRRGDREASTYHAQAMAGLDEPGGRFAQARHVTGSAPSVEYPKLPGNSPWSGDPVPPEEPLGYSVNDLEPTGEAHELAQSQAIGEPEPGAITQSRVPNQQLMSAVEGLGSPPDKHEGASPRLRAPDATGRAVSWGSVASTSSQRCDGDDPNPRTLAGDSAPARNSLAVPSTHVPGHPSTTTIKRRKL